MEKSRSYLFPECLLLGCGSGTTGELLKDGSQSGPDRLPPLLRGASSGLTTSADLVSSFFLFPFFVKKFRKVFDLGLSSDEVIAESSAAVDVETFPFWRALRRLSFIFVFPLKNILIGSKV